MNELFLTALVVLAVASVSFAVPSSLNLGPDSAGRTAVLRGIPLNQPGYRIDPYGMAGTWYEFMYRTPGLDDFNTVLTYVPVALFDGNRPSLVLNSTIRFAVKQPRPGCIGIFSQTNYSSSGDKVGVTWITGSKPAPTTYTTFFTDYDTVEIAYRCLVPNNKTGLCDEPWFFVNVRVKPAELTNAAKAYIAQTFNFHLAAYGYSVNDLKETGWDASLPECNADNTPEPKDYTALINKVRVF